MYIQKYTKFENCITISFVCIVSARALSKLLENRYHQVPWPSTTAPLSQILNMVLKRINEASGTYQMFDVLADVMILHE